MTEVQRFVYGPVPSRRLGFSLGVDILPFKTCTLDCVYCQLGSTGKTVIRRGSFFPPKDVLAQVREALGSGQRVDVITFSGSGEPTLLALGDLTLFVIERDGKHGIRLKDKNSKRLKEFTGLKWYPVQPGYRIAGTWTEYDPPKQIPVVNVVGQTQNQPCPGYVTFTVHGKTLRLEPIQDSPDDRELFFIFRDGTSGETTYPPGRFLTADSPVEGKVVLDFNKAVNPPCAFTPFATCPLPPPQNRLKVKIEAGEMRYGEH